MSYLPYCVGDDISPWSVQNVEKLHTITIRYSGDKGDKINNGAAILLGIVLISIPIKIIIFDRNDQTIDMIGCIMLIILAGMVFFVGINNIVNYPRSLILHEDRIKFSNINEGLFLHHPMVEIKYDTIKKMEMDTSNLYLNIYLKKKGLNKNRLFRRVLLKGMNKKDMNKVFTFLKRKKIQIIFKK